MERVVRQCVATACRRAQQCDVPVVQVTRSLALPDRTVRRWRNQSRREPGICVTPRGRASRPASREERNQVFQFLRQHGTTTPQSALRAAFPQIPRCDLSEILSRYRRVQRRKRERRQSRLQWKRPGAVWAADFKERREPIEGRYPWILAVKDLASRCQLAWLPVESADATTVQAAYAQLFAEHGPPLVMKSDNGGPFRDEETKQLLAEYDVIPLYNPRRHPAYNGGVERANGQLAGYQEAVAAFHGRAGLPTCADAAAARQVANDLSRPGGWQELTSAQLWEQRASLTSAERTSFLAAVMEQRINARAALNLPADTPLGHYPAAAVDRRAVRDALVAQDLLQIHPRRRPKTPASVTAKNKIMARDNTGAGILQPACATAATTSRSLGDSAEHSAPLNTHPNERVHSSTNKTTASGQNYR